MRHLIAIVLVYFYTTLAAAADFSRVYVFGDSLSDTGNIASLIGEFPNPPFFNNRISNGPVSVETFAANLGLDANASLHLVGPAQGSNYAVAGARTAGITAIDLPTQVNLFLANHGGVAPADALYVVFIGGNDVRDARNDADEVIATQRVDTAVQAEVAQLQVLLATGARDVIVMNVPDIGLIPENGLLELAGDTTARERATALTKRYNRSLKQQVKSLRRASRPTGAKITMFDTFDAFEEIIEHATENGFTNTVDACFSSITFSFYPGCGFGVNFPNYIFFDEIHPTARVHAMIGTAATKEFLEEKEHAEHD